MRVTIYLFDKKSKDKFIYDIEEIVLLNKIDNVFEKYGIFIMTITDVKYIYSVLKFKYSYDLKLGIELDDGNEMLYDVRILSYKLVNGTIYIKMVGYNYYKLFSNVNNLYFKDNFINIVKKIVNNVGCKSNIDTIGMSDNYIYYMFNETYYDFISKYIVDLRYNGKCDYVCYYSADDVLYLKSLTNIYEKYKSNCKYRIDVTNTLRSGYLDKVYMMTDNLYGKYGYFDWEKGDYVIKGVSKDKIQKYNSESSDSNISYIKDIGSVGIYDNDLVVKSNRILNMLLNEVYYGKILKVTLSYVISEISLFDIVFLLRYNYKYENDEIKDDTDRVIDEGYYVVVGVDIEMKTSGMRQDLLLVKVGDK